MLMSRDFQIIVEQHNLIMVLKRERDEALCELGKLRRLRKCEVLIPERERRVREFKDKLAERRKRR